MDTTIILYTYHRKNWIEIHQFFYQLGWHQEQYDEQQHPKWHNQSDLQKKETILAAHICE